MKKYLSTIFSIFILWANPLPAEPTNNGYGNSSKENPAPDIEDLSTYFMKVYGPSAAIMDVGCGWGQNLLCLYRKGFKNLFGIDLDYKHLEFIRNNLLPSTIPNTPKLINGKFPDKMIVSQKKIRFSAFIFYNVFQFMEGSEISLALIDALKFLKDEGMVYMRITNLQNHDNAYYQKKLKEFLDKCSSIEPDNLYKAIPYKDKFFGEDYVLEKYSERQKRHMPGFFHHLYAEQMMYILQYIGFSDIQYAHDSYGFTIVGFKKKMPSLLKMEFISWMKSLNQSLQN